LRLVPSWEGDHHQAISSCTARPPHRMSPWHCGRKGSFTYFPSTVTMRPRASSDVHWDHGGTHDSLRAPCVSGVAEPELLSLLAEQVTYAELYPEHIPKWPLDTWPRLVRVCCVRVLGAHFLHCCTGKTGNLGSQSQANVAAHRSLAQRNGTRVLRNATLAG